MPRLEGAIACSWGLALLASPRSTDPTRPEIPEGAAAGLRSESCCRPFRAKDFFLATYLGLTPQATCCRACRSSAPESRRVFWKRRGLSLSVPPECPRRFSVPGISPGLPSADPDLSSLGRRPHPRP